MDKFKSNIDDKALEDLNNKITNARLLDWGGDYNNDAGLSLIHI